MKLVDLSVTRPVAVSMAFIAVMVFGAVSYSRLQVDLLPDLSFPTVTIETEYVGVGPREMETLVSQPIEEAVSVVQGVRQVTSRSRPNRSDITIQFRWGTDMDFAVLNVREKLDALRPLIQNACNDSPVPCHWLDLLPSFDGRYDDYILADGLNPTPAGARVVAEQIWALIERECLAQ